MLSIATIIFLCVIGYAIVVLFAISLCKVAADADAQVERFMRERNSNVKFLSDMREARGQDNAHGRMVRDTNSGEQIDG